MVAIYLKYTAHSAVELQLDSPLPLRAVLDKCTEKTGVVLGGIIALRNDKVIQPEDLVNDGDEIVVFPALSGG